MRVPYRATVKIEIEGELIVGVGDAPAGKQAEKIAAMSALLQLDAKNLVGIVISSAIFFAK